jgi:hypothetical protein
MRAEEWKGLITNASPYLLPPGAATEQVNLQGHVPGQLSVRGGMRQVLDVIGMDIYPYFGAGSPMAVTVTDQGHLVIWNGVMFDGPPTDAPSQSSPSASSGSVGSNYLFQFQEFGGESPK